MSLSPPRMGRAHIHPIEEESYRILRDRIDLSALPPLSRAVTERVIHTTADLAWAEDLVLDEAALQGAWNALAAGARIVADVQAVAVSITSRRVEVPLADPQIPLLAERWGTTRTAAAIRHSATRVGPGAVWVIGNAPTALFELLDHELCPALVVGLPVGFVGAAAAKAALRETGWPSLTNRSERGGATIAAAAVNALLYLSEDQR